MATTTVLVTQLAGQAWIRDADGNLTPLREGMRIPADAQVITASGSSVQLQADGQPPLTLGENQDVALNADVFEDIPVTEAAVPTAADPLVENLIAAINNGQDPLAELDPTAATLAGGGGAGSTFVRLASVLEATSPLALAYPRGAGEVPEDRRSGAAATTATAAAAEPTEPAPTEPAPTEPAPTEPAPTEPAPTEPAPTEPAPTEPAPTEPAPTEPAPTEPAPTEPAPTEPAPTEPAPTEPAPTEPAPTEPAPTEPAPTEPAPTEPAPTEPAPTEPAPTEPAPTEPAPTEPAPTEPAPTEPAPTEPAPTEPAPTEPETLAITGGQITVAERDLAAGTAVASGSFSITSNKGVESITIEGTTINMDDLAAGKKVTVPNGELTITAITKTADGYQVEYEYRLSGAVSHDQSKGEDTVLDVELDISVTSTTGASESSNISVSIEDDVPELSGSENIHTGNTIGEFTGGLTFTKGADSDGFGLKIDGISNLPSGWTYKAAGDGGSASVFDATGKEIFQITLQQDGSYTVKQLAELSQTEQDGFGKGDLKSGNYKDGLSLGDSSGLLITASDKNGSTPVNVSGQGIGGGNNHLQSGDKLNFAFDEAVSDFTITINRSNGKGDPGEYTTIFVNGVAYEVELTGNSWVISAEALGITGGIKEVTLEVTGPSKGNEGAKFTVAAGEWHSMPTDVKVDFDVNVKGTDGDLDEFNGSFNVSSDQKPTEPSNPTGPTDPTEHTVPTPAISLTQVDVEHVHQTVTETTYTKGSVTITVDDGKVSVVGMDLVEPTSNTVQLSKPGVLNLEGGDFNGVTNAHGHLEWNTSVWPNVQEPKDLLLLSKSIDHYDLSGLVGDRPGWSGLIIDKDTGATVNIAFFAGIVFGDGNTSYLPGFESEVTATTTGYDLIELDLDAWVDVPGDASDTLTSLTISGLGDDATVVSVIYGGKAIVYSVENGVLTLQLPVGEDGKPMKVLDLHDVSITLQVPVGHAPLNLQASVTASNDHGSNSAQDDLSVHVSHSDAGTGSGSDGGDGGDGGSGGGEDPDPVVNAPQVDLAVSSRTVETTSTDPLEGTTAVNGGATDPSGNGFNLDAAGNVVAVGANVRVWGTYSTKGVDGSGKTPINDFDHDGDGKSDILVYKNGEFSLAQYGENLIRLGYDNNGESNANANNRSGSEASTDLFLLHSQSGYWKANDGPDGKDSGHWSSFGNFTGNKVQYVDGKTAPDYVILIGDAAGKSPDHAPNFNRNEQINVLDTFTISGVVGSGNSVEGVFSGGKLVAGGTDDKGKQYTQSEIVKGSTVVDVLRETVYDVVITATLADVDHSGEGLSQLLVLTGVPASATVTYGGTVLTADADGHFTIKGDLSADGHSVIAKITISGAGDADFTLTARAQSYDLQDTSSTATGHDDVAVVSGSAGEDNLLGTDDRDLLLGGDGNDQLHGGKGDDRLEGGDGNDILVGGAGNDTLLGGAGDDVFVWNHGDEGTAAAPAVDVVKDFGTGNDVLDLSDLLQGENKSNLSDYLGASTETVNGKATTVLNISTSGHLASEGANQKIVLEGHNLDTSDQAKLVQDLISQGKLNVDL